jgi:hypothetical protein
VPERRSGLSPSDKELPERRRDAFRQKIPPFEMLEIIGMKNKHRS